MRLGDAINEYIAKQEAAAAPEAGAEDGGAEAEADAVAEGEEAEGEDADEGAEAAPEDGDEGEEEGETGEGETLEADAAEDEGEEGEAEEDIPEAPYGWDNTPEEWAALTPAARDKIIKREANIEQKINTEAGRRIADRKHELEAAVSAEKQKVAAQLQRLETLIPKIEQRVKAEYEGVDWQKLSVEQPDEYIRLRASHDADMEALTQARREHEANTAQQMKTYQEEQFNALLERNPQYQGAEGGKKLQEDAAKINSFAASIGYTTEQLNAASARDFEVLRDAMNFRNLKEKAASPAPKKKPAPAPTVTKPAPRKAAGDTVKQKRVKDAETRFNKLVASGGSKMAQIAALAEIREARKGA